MSDDPNVLARATAMCERVLAAQSRANAAVHTMALLIRQLGTAHADDPLLRTAAIQMLQGAIDELVPRENS